MSRQQRRTCGRDEFRRYPFVETRPLPDVRLSSYIRHALSDDGLGTHIATTCWPKKPFQCKRTGKSYLLWDNYLLHVKALSGGPSAKDVLDVYVSPYDDRTFRFRENCKLHNRVKRMEEVAEMELARRAGASGSALEKAVKKKRVEFRFWDRPVDQDLAELELEDIRRKRQLEDPKKAIDVPEKVEQEEAKECSPDHGPKADDKKWPANYDDLPVVQVPIRNANKNPSYRGWTHSDDADSWYLEARTEGSHDSYTQFTQDLLAKRVICPKLWPMVFPM